MLLGSSQWEQVRVLGVHPLKLAPDRAALAWLHVEAATQRVIMPFWAPKRNLSRFEGTRSCGFQRRLRLKLEEHLGTKESIPGRHRGTIKGRPVGTEFHKQIITIRTQKLTS